MCPSVPPNYLFPDFRLKIARYLFSEYTGRHSLLSRLSRSFSREKKKNKTKQTNTTSLGVVSFPRQIWFLHLQSHTDVFLFHTRSFVHKYVKLSLNEEQQKHCHLLDECGFAVSQQTIPTINSTQTTETLHLQAILITGYKRKKISLCRDSLWETPEWHTTKIKNT